MWEDFKSFIARGNVVGLAVAVVIGASFSTIVNTLVEGIIMPPIGWITRGIDFSKFYYDLSGRYNNLEDPKEIQNAIESGAPLIMYGKLINDVITFLIVAAVIFLIVRWTKRYFDFLEKESGPSKEIELLTEIRDLLKNKQ